jgi:hypothetical protein
LYVVMRLPLLLLSCLLALAACPAYAAKPPKEKPPKEKPPTEARVDHLGTLPAPAGIGANFKKIDGRQYMFVTGTAGLYVYDVTTAASPTPVSVLPLPHYENEDVSIGGNRLLLSGDGTLGGGVLIVIDISNPQVPVPERVVKMEPLGEGHTASCIQDCHYAWVAGDQIFGGVSVLDLDKAPSIGSGKNGVDVDDGGWTFGLVPLPDPSVRVGTIQGYDEFGWSTHDVAVDEAGIAWVAGGNGTVAFDVSRDAYGPGNLTDPQLVARTGPAAVNDGDLLEAGVPGVEGAEPNPDNAKDTNNDFIHHNAWRADAREFESRPAEELSKPGVRDGELVLITEEDIWSRQTAGSTPGGCETQGSFQTWQVKQFGETGADQATLTQLGSWTTEFNELLAAELGSDWDDDDYGRDIVPTNGLCSSHYFSERDGIVATAWYEQGVRFLDVSDPDDIEQVGFFIPPGGTPWATYWSPTDRNVLYVIDNNRGIDVLRFERGKAKKGKPVKASTRGWWLQRGTKRRKAAAPHPRFGYVCRLPHI